MYDTVSDAPASRPVLNGRYELHRRIARGGMADVFLAKDQLLDRPVAVKVLFPQFAAEETFVTRFRREAQAAANLNHPNIVAVYDWGEHEDTYFIVMEYVEGQTLAEMIATEGHVAPERAADIAIEVAGALGFAHRNGTVHRDVKPGNIMINRSGQVKVADFGIARALSGTEDELTQTGSVMGTASYFSPEQAQGRQVDPRSDLYSLGVVLFEMLTGEPPFNGASPVAIAYKHVQETPARVMTKNPAVPAPLDQVVERLLRKNPADRYPAADELRSELRRFRDGLPLTGPANGAAAPATTGGSPTIGAPPVGAAGTDQTVVAGGGFASSGLTGGAANHQPATGQTQPLTGVDATTAMPTGAQLTGRGAAMGPDTGRSRAVIDTSRAVPAGAAVRQEETVEEYYEAPSRTGFFVVMLGLILAALVVLILWISTLTGDDGTEAPVDTVEVPSVVGMAANDASEQLLRADLEYEVVLQPNEDVEINQVFNQEPAAGELVEPESVVKIFVSQAPETEDVPLLVGQSVEAAEQQLDLLGLESDKVFEASDEFAENIVISTEPAAGTTVNQGTQVQLIVSAGPSQVELPNLNNLDRATAQAQLAAAGFQNPPEVRTEGSGTVPFGQVIRTEPEAGQRISVDSTVVLVVSSGPDQVQIPQSIIGLSQEAAQTVLQGEDLQLVPQFGEDFLPAGDPRIGLVTRTNPGVGQVLPQGSTVQVFIGQEQQVSETTATTAAPTSQTTETTAGSSTSSSETTTSTTADGDG